VSQRTWDTIIPSSTSGNQLATYLNELAAAVDSNNKGASRPATLDAGGFWIDSTDEASPDFLWYLKCWTGTIDITLMTINISTGAISLQGADGSFQITKTSADSVAPLLKFIKERVAANGQTLIGDVLGEIQFQSAGDDNSNPISAKIKVVASDDATATEAGAYFVFEGITVNGISLTEWMRLKDGNLAIGLVTAEEKLHVKGNVKFENETDSVNGAIAKFRKRRVSGGGQVLSGDILGGTEYMGTDPSGNEVQEAVTVTAYATENFGTTFGSKLEIGIKKIGAVVNTIKVVIGDVLELKEKTVADEIRATILHLGSQDVATAASITALSNTKSLVRFTGSTATSLKGITAPTDAMTILLHNDSTANVTVENEDAGATAANRFSLPSAVIIGANESAEFFYDISDSRWKQKSGSGGGVSNSVSDSLSLAGGGTLAIDLNKGLQTFRAQGASGEVTLSTTPFGGSAPVKDGSIVYVVGNSDTNTITIPQADVAYSCFMDGDVTIAKGQVAGFMWINALTRYVRIK
jgi:hypothetical protein